MSGSMALPAVTLIVGGAAVAGVGLLGLRGRLPRNSVAGVRTRATMHSDEAFEVANRVAGPLIILGGVVAALTGLAALVLAEPVDVVGVLVGTGLTAAVVVVGGVRGHRAAQATPS